MNTNTKKITVLFALAIMLVACTTFVRASYQTLGSVATIVNTAREGYNDFYSAGKISPELALKVEKAYPIYQSSIVTAIMAVQGYQKLIAAGTVVTPDDANKAIATAQKDTNTLLSLFAEAGIPKTDPVVIEPIVPKAK